MSDPASRRGGRGKGRFYPWPKRKRTIPYFNEADVDYSNISLNETLGLSNIPYKGWYRYFPDEEYSARSPLSKKLQAAVRLLEDFKSSITFKDMEELRYFNLDLQVPLQHDAFLAAWPSFEYDLNNNPETTLNCLGLALHSVACGLTSDSDLDWPYLRIRIVHHEPIVPLRDIKANSFGKLVTVRGTVIRVGPTRLLCTRMGFTCAVCRRPQSLTLKDGAYAMPKSCPAEDCRSKMFVPLCCSSLTQTKNIQIIKIQESIGEGEYKNEGGRVPRNIEIEFTEDLVDSCCPGDTVTITGIVKINHEEGKKKSGPNLFTLFLEGNSVINTKGSSGRVANNIEFSLKDYYAIQEIYYEKNVFRLLVNSLCPAVYGHELIKAGILLSLVGGASLVSNSPINKRALIHVLIVGDPGLGKSHLLHAAASVAPRGVYVCGNTTTSSGLTVTLTKETGGDFALEAGALILANHGVCCIDEFDKMVSQHQALLEAMEQEQISVAKGGVVCSLPAHSTIIAAANPVGGHYNQGKSVIENLRMSSPLLSRFDLVFILLDRPDRGDHKPGPKRKERERIRGFLTYCRRRREEELLLQEVDSRLSEHVLALHTGNKRSSTHYQSAGNDTMIQFDESTTFDSRLIDRLKIPPGEHLDLVPQELMRKYLAYVRKYVPSPQLSSEAGKILQNFYLELRSSHRHKDSTPVTTRQLESMIRMTEARAKVELREEATEEDARDVVELMQSTLQDVFRDDTGGLDFKRSINGTGLSQASRAKRFIAGLQRQAQIDNKDTFTTDEMKQICLRLNLQVPDIISLVSILNTQGFLLKISAKSYKLLTI